MKLNSLFLQLLCAFSQLPPHDSLVSLSPSPLRSQFVSACDFVCIPFKSRNTLYLLYVVIRECQTDFYSPPSLAAAAAATSALSSGTSYLVAFNWIQFDQQEPDDKVARAIKPPISHQSLLPPTTVHPSIRPSVQPAIHSSLYFFVSSAVAAACPPVSQRSRLLDFPATGAVLRGSRSYNNSPRRVQFVWMLVKWSIVNQSATEIIGNYLDISRSKRFLGISSILQVVCKFYFCYSGRG